MLQIGNDFVTDEIVHYKFDYKQINK
jgi:hypothetical protein